MVEFFNLYWRLIVTLISITGISITVLKLITNSYAIRKIEQNDLIHLTKNLEEHKKEDKDFRDKLNKDDKEFKKEIRNELHKINLSCNRMERKIERRDIICNERHKTDKK